MEIILASNNMGKLREMREILEPLGIGLRSQKDAGFLGEVEENGSTFEENALIKARAVYLAAGGSVIADDSGLEVDFLGGKPGIYSHRYAGEGASDADRRRKLLEEMAGASAEKRGARFVCVIAYIDENGGEKLFRAECEGTIGYEERGTGGFGYDAVFLAREKSFAEISAEEKNALSHRGKALQMLKEYFAKGKNYK